MPRFRTLSLNDFDGSNGSMTVNVDNTIDPVLATARWNLFKLAIEFATRGLVVRESDTFATQLAPASQPSADPLAQRQDKWILTYTDVTAWLNSPTNTIANPNLNKIFTLEIPTADLSLRVNNSEIIYTESMLNVPAAIGAVVNTFEALAKSPTGGDVNILRIHSVGRNV